MDVIRVTGRIIPMGKKSIMTMVNYPDMNSLRIRKWFGSTEEVMLFSKIFAIQITDGCGHNCMIFRIKLFEKFWDDPLLFFDFDKHFPEKNRFNIFITLIRM